jgi:plasmid stabilization system protein ParE
VKLRINAEVEAEVFEAAAWYEDRQPGLGDRFFETVSGTIDSIQAYPHRFARVETVRTSPTVRRAQVEGFPYTVVYEAQPDEIVILAVAHMSRRPGYWRGRN